MYITRPTNNQVDFMRCNTIIHYLTNQIKMMTDIAVIGLSGGADSTLCAALCASDKCLGEKNVYGVSMPYDDTDLKTFNARSAKLAEYLGINHLGISIGKPCEDAQMGVEIGFGSVSGKAIKLSQLNLGNLRSRLRAVTLYTVCAQIAEENPGKRVRVIGTGNLSEEYIGYDTKGGDALSDFSPIGDLYKQEVYDLLSYFAMTGDILSEHIDPVPSAGLWPGQTDEKELGFSYNDMAPAIALHRKWKAGGDIVEDVLAMAMLSPSEMAAFNFVKDRYETNRHKHEVIPVVSVSQFR